MKQLELKQLIETADEICRDLTRANVGNILREKLSLKDKFHFELLKFAVYLADADGDITQKEADIIHEYLDIEANVLKLKEIKVKERLDRFYGSEVPSCLKYPVLADAGHKLNPDPYAGQKAMYFYDCFKIFGQTIMTAQEKDVNEGTAERFTSFMANMEKFIKELAVWYAGDQKAYRAVEPVIEDKETDEEKAKKLEELLADLDSLTGMYQVKHQVHSLVNLIKVQKMREAHEMKISDVSKHMVFMGNPGTGKTTVARKLAEIYKYLGVLQKGQLVEVDRSGLVKGYVGQTATRVQEVVSEALGGVLFVDEAYALTVGKGEGDFGQEAVDTLLKSMEDHRSEMIVVVAGYTNLMNEFLSSNPGLKSRFSNFIYFEDYTEDELMEILKNNLKKQDYKLSPEAEKKAYEMITFRVNHKPDNFANARDIRNFMEHAISNHATRVVGIKDAADNKELLSTIEVEDLQKFE